MSPNTLHERSYAFAKDCYFEAEAIADQALGVLSDFVCRLELWGTWGEAEAQIKSDLERTLDRAEETRRASLARLRWEATNYAKHVTERA